MYGLKEGTAYHKIWILTAKQSVDWVMPMVTLKRVYDALSDKDGKRILVDRAWPRGKKREELQLTDWMKELAPSAELRKWFGHDPERWARFVRLYREELQDPERKKRLNELAEMARTDDVTLLFAAKDREHNQAVVLRDVLREM